MALPNIEELRRVGDFATLYQWDIAFLTFPAAGQWNLSPFDLNVRCESAEIPNLTGQSIEVMVRGHKVKQPGIHAYSNVMTLVFVETVDNKIQQFLQTWREICWQTRTGYQNKKLDVECGILLTRLDRQLVPIWSYHLIGCYLEDYQMGTLDGASSDAIKPNMVLAYDYFEDGQPQRR